MLRQILNKAQRPLNDELKRVKRNSWASAPPTYSSDGLIVANKHVPFLADERFRSAYRTGMASGQRLTGSEGGDPHIEWRVAVVC